MILLTVCQRMIELSLGKSIAITFIDYSEAFDTISYKFLDEALEASGAPVKIIALFRAMYEAVSAYTTVPDTDGKTTSLSTFPINRGVLYKGTPHPHSFSFSHSSLFCVNMTQDPTRESLSQMQFYTL